MDIASFFSWLLGKITAPLQKAILKIWGDPLGKSKVELSHIWLVRKDPNDLYLFGNFECLVAYYRKDNITGILLLGGPVTYSQQKFEEIMAGVLSKIREEKGWLVSTITKVKSFVGMVEVTIAYPTDEQYCGMYTIMNAEKAFKKQFQTMQLNREKE